MANLQPAINTGTRQDAAPPLPVTNASQGAGQALALGPQGALAAAAVAGAVRPGPQAAAAAVGPPAAIYQALVRHRTFASWFADPGSNPNHQDAFQVVSNFDPLSVTPLTVAALKQAILGRTPPNTFLCCTSIHGTVPKVYLIHALSGYPRALTGRTTPWDNKIIGYLGGVLSNSIVNVVLPETIFDETPNTLVLNAETLIQELPNLAADALLPRVRANDADNAVQRRSRFLTYLPTRFAPLLLNNKGYIPKRVWDILVQRFQEEGCMEQMTPLLNWIRISLHATGQNDTGPPATHIDLVAPFADQDLMDHCMPFRQVLTGIQGPSPGLETAIAQFATAVNSQVTKAQTARYMRELE
jgi:hypothetical protein